MVALKFIHPRLQLKNRKVIGHQLPIDGPPLLTGSPASAPFSAQPFFCPHFSAKGSVLTHGFRQNRWGRKNESLSGAPTVGDQPTPLINCVGDQPKPLSKNRPLADFISGLKLRKLIPVIREIRGWFERLNPR
jgi:hypothetical protein